MVHSFHWSWVRDAFGPSIWWQYEPVLKADTQTVMTEQSQSIEAYTSFHLLLYLTCGFRKTHSESYFTQK